MFWAVAIELQLYLIFPLLLRLLNRGWPVVLVRLVAAAAAMLRLLAWLVDPAVDLNALTYYSLVGRIDQFLLGMLAAVVFVRDRRLLTMPLLAVSSAAAVAMLWLFNQLHGYASPAGWRVVWVDLEGLVWACFVASYVAVLERRTGKLARAVVAVGERSFSIYLLHFVVVTAVAVRSHLLVPVGDPVTGAFLTGVLVVVPLVMAVGTVSFAAIERPFLTMRGRYIHPPGMAAGAPVLAPEHQDRAAEPHRP